MSVFDLSFLSPRVVKLQNALNALAPWYWGDLPKMTPGILDLATAEVAKATVSPYPGNNRGFALGCYNSFELQYNPQLKPFVDANGCPWAAYRLRRLDTSWLILVDFYRYLDYYAGLFDAMYRYEGTP